MDFPRKSLYQIAKNTGLCPDGANMAIGVKN
jgi:hypothetical protein